MATIERTSRRIYNLDPSIFPADPRKLDTLKQTIYVIRCLERGLTKADILNLFMGDDFSVDIIFELIRDNDLMLCDDKTGKWSKTEKTAYLFTEDGSPSLVEPARTNRQSPL